MRDYRLLKSSTNTTLQEFARPEAAANTGDRSRDHQVESNSTAVSVPVIPRQFNILDPCQLVNSSQSEQQCVQQDPQRHHLGSSHLSCTETPSFHAAANAAHEKVGAEGNPAGSYTQPVAHQFMN